VRLLQPIAVAHLSLKQESGTVTVALLDEHSLVAHLQLGFFVMPNSAANANIRLQTGEPGVVMLMSSYKGEFNK
jgi:hypothetical protein